MQAPYIASSIREIGKKILDIRNKLESKITSTLWISDLHGDGERFIRVLQGRFGMLYTTCQETLGKKSPTHIRAMTRLIRRKKWSADLNIPKKIALDDLLLIIQRKFREAPKYRLDAKHHWITAILFNFKTKTKKLPAIFFENSELFDYAIKDVATIILDMIPENIIVLGDIFDRGPTPDKIIRSLSFNYYLQRLTMVWGNHDILWLGATAGNKSLVAEVLRITCRYDNLDLLKRLEIDIDELKKFATEIYPVNSIPKSFKSKTPICRSIEKALAIMQLKLEEQTISRHKEYEMDSRMWASKLAFKLKNKDYVGLADTLFPTLDLGNPSKLSQREQSIIDDLTLQFSNSRKLKVLMSLFIKKAKVFSKHQDFLCIHALIPTNAKGEYEEFIGESGPALLEKIQSIIDSVGKNYLENRSQNINDIDLIFYLWCGPKSPFFGKDAMKTFEKYFLKDKKTHKEKILFWEKNILDKKFQKKIKKDFQIQRIVFGHTPKDIKHGDKMLIGDGFAINIDGGFSGAYLERGHALVRTSKNLYGIVLPDAREAKKALSENQEVPLMIEIIEKHARPVLYKNLICSKQLLNEEKNLILEIEKLKNTTQKID